MKKLKANLNLLLDNYLAAKDEILREITVFGENKGNKIQLEIVNKKIIEVSKIINK